MSNIVKKITKKYKWLRFLNYKTTKLAVLSAALFGLCLSSGASFAKYRDENYGGGNAGAAKFDVGVVSSISHGYSLANVKNEYGIYALVANFNIDFSLCEVSLEYTISLRMSNDKTISYDDAAGAEGYSFIHEADTLYTLIEESTTTPKPVDNNTASSLTGSKFSSIDKKVAYASNEDGWARTSDENDWLIYSSNTLNISGYVSASEATKDHSVMFFVNIDGSAEEIPSAYILYNLQVWQVVTNEEN